jgi:hypothetical protein
MARKPRLSSDAWIKQIFQAKAAKTGGIVRRQITSVAQFASSAALEAEVKARGFHMVETGAQYVIFCHTGNFRMIC